MDIVEEIKKDMPLPKPPMFPEPPKPEKAVSIVIHAIEAAHYSIQTIDKHIRLGDVVLDNGPIDSGSSRAFKSTELYESVGALKKILDK